MFVRSRCLGSARCTPLVVTLLFALLAPARAARADTDGTTTYFINATAGLGGSISNPGNNPYAAGSTVVFTITPDLHYHIDDVVVDLVSINAANSYQFPNLAANHTIAASFAIDSVTITTSHGPNGDITPGGSVPVPYGGSQGFSIVADPGYHVAGVLVDGNPVDVAISYSFTNATTNHTLSATFAADAFTIVASAGPGGGISPSGSVAANAGDTPSFDITHDAHYHIDDVLVDGGSVGAVASYDFGPIDANHTIAASFAIDQVTLVVNTAGSGSVQKSPDTATYDYGASVQLSPSPDAGWAFAGWSGDAGGNASPLTVSMTQNRIILATFTEVVSSGITINDVSVNEGNSSNTSVQFTVRVSPTVNHPVTVSFATASGTATSGEDFLSSSGNLTIPSNTSTVPLFVTVKGDTKFESDESYKVRLANAQGAVLEDSIGIGTIRNDDAPPATPAISINDVSTLEGKSGTHTLVFTVSLSGPTTQSVRVSYATKGVSATVSDNDYVGVSGTLTIPAGATSRTISVAVYGDSRPEPDETFQMNLSNPVGATIARAQGIGTILNDDSASRPSLTIGDVSRNEGNSGTTSFNFVVSVTPTTNVPITVRYATAGITATVRNNDYIGRLGTLTIPANAPSGTITILVKGDTKVESNEKFAVNLSSPTNATIGDPQGIGTIVNDDGHNVVDTPAAGGEEPLYAGPDDTVDELAAAATDHPALWLESNPVRGDLRLSFALPEAGDVRISVVDLQGRLVGEVASGHFDGGRHDVRLAGSGSTLPAGVYFARLETANGSIVQRFVTLR